jgi:hypothetical protein
MKALDIINSKTNYVIGDGIITYYKNGLYTGYKIIESYEYKRKIK